MRNSFTRKELALTIACALALGVFSESAKPQARDINEHALLLDSRVACMQPDRHVFIEVSGTRIAQ